MFRLATSNERNKRATRMRGERWGEKKEKEKNETIRRIYPRGFAHRGHVCIIRDKPITARNACQAVKRYPGPQPGGLMISLGNLDHLRPSSSFSFSSPLLLLLLLLVSSSSLPLLFTSSSSIHRARDALSLRSLLPALPQRTTSSGQLQRHDATTNH